MTGTIETRWASMARTVGLTLILLLGLAKSAAAIPAFARQTGFPCSVCHLGGFYPELTPFGRMFKAHGYTFSNADSRSAYQAVVEGNPEALVPHLAGMLIFDYSHFKHRLPKDQAQNQWTQWYLSNGNNNLSVPSQASLFYGGTIVGKLGAFIQGTYDGAANAWVWDNTDIRLADSIDVLEEPLVYGLSLNNGPTVQDLWNTTPVWSFPYISSSVAPGPAAGTFISGIAGQVAGVGPYLMWGQHFYAEVTPYVTGRYGALTWLNTFGAGVDQIVNNAAPYWRAVLFHDIGPHSFSLGHYGMYATAFGSGSSGPTNSYTDLAADAQYQYVGDPHAFSVKTSVVFEQQNNNASVLQGDAANRHDGLNTFNIFFSYYYNKLFGATVGYFDIAGSTDTGLYAPAPVTGSRSGNPRTYGGIFEIDVQPFSSLYDPASSHTALAMTRFTLQYTFYGKFNGASRDYDGFGRSASDNNTLYLAAWMPW